MMMMKKQYYFIGLLWLTSALLVQQMPAIAHAVSFTVDHRQSRRRHQQPVTRDHLNSINDVVHPRHLVNRNLRSVDDPTVQVLLKNARPYNRNKDQANTRKLEENNNVQFDGSYSLKFSQCLDVQTYNAELFNQDILEYSSSAKVVSVKSYVLFYICQTNVNCDYDADDVDLYMVDLPTYLSSAAQYRANIRNEYCEACNRFENYCNPQQEEVVEEAEEEVAAEAGGEEEANAEEEVEDAVVEQEEDAAVEEKEEEPEEENAEHGEEAEKEQENNHGEAGEEGGRKLEKGQRKLASQSINCNQCTAYECFAAANDDDQVQSREELDKSITEWIVDLAECKETGAQWNGMNLFVSAMCSPYGDGVELAVFVDEDCTMYTNQQSFYDVWDSSNENGVNYMTYAEEIIQNAFSELTPCSQQGYGYPDGYDGNDADQDNVEEDENEVNEYCQIVLEGEFVNFNNCAAEENNNQANAADDDGQYSWYKYDVKDADDINEVCTVLKRKEGAYTWSYDMENSGTWYERDRDGQITSKDSTTRTSSSIYVAPAIVVVVATICVFVVGGAAFLTMRRQKYAESSESVYSGGTMI